MAVTATPVFIQNPVVTPQNFVEGTDSAGTYKTLFTAGANGSKVVACVASSDDGSAAHVVTLAIQRSGTNFILGSCSVPVNAGTSGSVANIDLLAGGASSYITGLPTDNDGQKYLFLKSGDTLVATFATALTSAKRLNIITIGADF